MATIRDLMTNKVETVGPDQTAREAAGFMLSADTGSIPVCDNGKVIGMITDRDIASHHIADSHRSSPLGEYAGRNEREESDVPAVTERSRSAGRRWRRARPSG